jgi:hypothetical protein
MPAESEASPGAAPAETTFLVLAVAADGVTGRVETPRELLPLLQQTASAILAVRDYTLSKDTTPVTLPDHRFPEADDEMPPEGLRE